MKESENKSRTLSNSRKGKGRFFTISAPSGTGKTTLVVRLLKEFPNLKRSISCTTRPPRPGEKEGVDYYFLDRETFEKMLKKDSFFEHEEVHGAFYGTPKAPILQRRAEGLDTILDIDTRGAQNLKKAFPDTCSIFLMPPSLEVLEERLRKRQTEEESSLQRRLQDARSQMDEHDKFDYVIMNDDVDRAYEQLRKIILKKIK